MIDNNDDDHDRNNYIYIMKYIHHDIPVARNPIVYANHGKLVLPSKPSSDGRLGRPFAAWTFLLQSK